MQFPAFIRFCKRPGLTVLLSALCALVIGVALIEGVDTVVTKKIFNDICRSVLPRIQVGATRDAVDSILVGLADLSKSDNLSIEIGSGKNKLIFGQRANLGLEKKFICDVPGMPEMNIILYKKISVPSWAFCALFLMLGIVIHLSLSSWFRYRIGQAVRKGERELYLQVASQVAHDIRAPLGGISIGVQAINKDPKAAAELIRVSVERLQSLAEDLLATRKQSENVFKSEISLMKIEECLREVILGSGVIGSKISLVVNLSSVQAQKNLIGTKNLYVRLFSNLVGNALEALNQDSERVNILIAEEKGNALITITNDGLLVPNKIIEKLNSGRSFSTKKFGNGLGVTGARRILESIGGQLTYRSLNGGGVICEVVVPLLNNLSSPLRI